MGNILHKIKKIPFPADQYIPRETKKTQIVLHHTVSPTASINGDVATWRNSKSRIATCIIIGYDGTPYQLFSSKYWGYHLGIKELDVKKLGFQYTFLDDNTIGIEIDSAGGLTKKRGKWYDTYGHIISNDDVEEYPDGFRGYFGFQKYSSEQIEALKELLLFWNKRYDIPLDYNEDMWRLSGAALEGKPGIWSHVSYRLDKSDCHPQPELIKMLKSLN